MTTAIAIPGLDGLAATPEARARFEGAAVEMAREYREATAAMRAALESLREQGDRIRAAFAAADCDSRGTWNSFGVDVTFGNTRVYRHGDGTDDYADLFKAMRRRAWRMLVDHLGVKNVMSLKRRAEFDEQLERGDLPEITERTIVSVILGLVGEARNFAQEAAREVFDLLRPERSGYKTNNRFRVGRRVILTYFVGRGYGNGPFCVNYHKDGKARAIEGVFLLLDGRGVTRDGKSELQKAVDAAGADGRGETEYFRFRCFKNGNLHLEFKRLDLVKQFTGWPPASTCSGRTRPMRDICILSALRAAIDKAEGR